MMRFPCGVWVGMLPLVGSCAQQHNTSMPACDCEEVLAFVVDYVERNYAGFHDKVRGAERQRYEAHKAELRARAGEGGTEAERLNQRLAQRDPDRGAPSEADCHRLLLEFTAFFRDPHLAVSYSRAWVDADTTNRRDRPRHQDAEGQELTVRTLDTNTLLLRLPDFGLLMRPRIDSMTEANRDRFTSARNLIIDVRGNPGGSDASFGSLRPLLYTGPVVTPGLSHYATDDNIRSFEAFLEEADLSVDLEG